MKLLLFLALMTLSQTMVSMSWKQDLDVSKIKIISKFGGERTQTYRAHFSNSKSVEITSFLQGPLKGTFHGTATETTTGRDGSQRHIGLPLKSPAQYYALLQGLYEAQIKKESEEKS